MKKLVLIFIALLFLSSCSQQNPEDMLTKSAKIMNELKGYHMDSTTKMEIGFLGFNMDFSTKNYTEIEKDGQSKKIMMEVKETLNGNPVPPVKMYLSKNKIGEYNYQSNRWNMHAFDPNEPTDQENKWFLNQLLSLYNPEGAVNQFLNSNSKKEMDIIGTKTINGIECTGVSVKMEADELMKSMGEFAEKTSGMKGSGSLFETIGNKALKNTKMIYWIGNNDHYIHRYESNLSGSFGKFEVNSNLSGYGKTISLK